MYRLMLTNCRDHRTLSHSQMGSYLVVVVVVVVVIVVEVEVVVVMIVVVVVDRFGREIVIAIWE